MNKKKRIKIKRNEKWRWMMSYLFIFIVVGWGTGNFGVNAMEQDEFQQWADHLQDEIELTSFIQFVFTLSPNLEYLSTKSTENQQNGIHSTLNMTHSMFPLLSYIMNTDAVTEYGMKDIFPFLKQKELLENTAEVFVQNERFEFKEDNQVAPSASIATSYSLEQLANVDFLVSHFYTVDSNIIVSEKDFNAEYFLEADMKLKKDVEGPQVLIYHTHSSEAFVDSVEGDASHTVVGLGDELTRIIEEEYGVEVMHLRGQYDSDRNKAYELIEPDLVKILKENPTIEVMIDLHRDGIPDDKRLVTTIDGKPTAQIMFFNGLCKMKKNGQMVSIGSIVNPYVSENMALSFQMHLKANELYTGFTRKIYLKGPRYNLHLLPKSLLIEVGAQTNTVEEAQNAMEPLAKILMDVLR